MEQKKSLRKPILYVSIQTDLALHKNHTKPTAFFGPDETSAKTLCITLEMLFLIKIDFQASLKSSRTIFSLIQINLALATVSTILVGRVMFSALLETPQKCTETNFHEKVSGIRGQKK